MFSLMTGVVIALIVVFAVMFAASLYKRCSSDEILVVFGSLLGGKKAICIHGGGRVIIPLLQGYRYMSLQPHTLDIQLDDALDKNNIRIKLPTNFIVGIAVDPDTMQNAAERILNFSPEEIASKAKDVIVGQLRDVVSTMSIEEINTDRPAFVKKIKENVEIELNKIGLHIITQTIRDINDEVGYIKAIGQKAAAAAIQQANIDVAREEKTGAIGVETATREKEVSVAKQKAEAAIGKKEAEKDQTVKTAEFEAEKVKGENQSKASVAEYNAMLAEKQAESERRSQVAQAQAKEAILKAEKLEMQARLEKNELAQQEVDKKKMEVNAQAQSEKARIEAEGQAKAITLVAEAEAKAIELKLKAKAEGIKQMVASCGGNSQVASAMMMIEIMPELVKTQVSALDKIKIDKLMVWDGGSKEGEGGVKGLVKNLMGVLPQAHDLAKMSGLELPEILGSTVAEQKTDKKPSDKKES